MTKRGLVGAWCPSLGATGFRLLDRSGRGNHGTLINMASTAWTTSGGKGALSFDGVSVSSQVDLAVPVPLGTVHTTSAWVFPRGQSTAFNFAGIIGQPSTVGNNQTASLFVSGPNSSSINTFGYTHFTGGVLSSGLTLENRWSFLCSVRVGTLVNLYLDGNLMTTGTLPQNGTFSPTVLGRRTDFAAFYNGNLDDVRLCDRALTAPEIRQLYLGGRGFGLLPERPRHRSKAAAAAFKAYWARRQSQLIGGGL